jgi:hypothetical protein
VGVPTFVQKSAFDLGIDLVQPLFSAIDFLLVGFDLGLKLANALLRRAKLVRKPLRGVDSMSAVLLGHVCGFVEELQDRLASGIQLAAGIVLPPRKLNYFGTHSSAPFPFADFHYNLFL